MRQMLRRPAPHQTADSSSSRSALIFSNILGLTRRRVDPDVDLYGSALLDPNDGLKVQILSTAWNHECLKNNAKKWGIVYFIENNRNFDFGS
jgi:hypothetical protein